MMSRKNYEAIAAILDDERSRHVPSVDEYDAGAMVAIGAIRTALTAYFTQDNPRFDAAKFQAAATTTTKETRQ